MNLACLLMILIYSCGRQCYLRACSANFDLRILFLEQLLFFQGGDLILIRELRFQTEFVEPELNYCACLCEWGWRFKLLNVCLPEVTG